MLCETKIPGGTPSFAKRLRLQIREKVAIDIACRGHATSLSESETVERASDTVAAVVERSRFTLAAAHAIAAGLIADLREMRAEREEYTRAIEVDTAVRPGENKEVAEARRARDFQAPGGPRSGSLAPGGSRDTVHCNPHP